MIRRSFSQFLVPLALLAAGSQAAPARESGTGDPLLDMRALDERVATAGHRLAVSAIDLCLERQWLPGFAVHDLSQYGDRDSAIQAFGLDAGPAVLAVASGGPAARAGLAPDDVLLHADGRPLPRDETARPGTYDLAERIIGRIEEAFADGRAELDTLRGGEARTIRIDAEEGCASRFQLVPSSRLNASADGRYVQVTSAIADYVRDDDELAAVLAHEFAHNILKHRARLDAAEVSRGLFKHFGRNARLFRETEMEADRLSVYLLDRAGYDPEAAARFWSRFGPRGLNLFATTHSDWRRRVAAFREETASLARQKAAGERPLPGFLRNAGEAGSRSEPAR